MVSNIYKLIFRGYYPVALAIMSSIMLLSLATASAQDIDPAHELTATWEISDTVALHWAPSADTTFPVVYRVYSALGSVQVVNGDAWHLVATESDTSAQFGLKELGIAQAQTLSFFVMSAIIVPTGDTIIGKASNTAVAIWNNNAGHGEITMHFISTPVETGSIGNAYNYHVVAVSSDSTSVITYSLIQAPDGMKIDSTTGMITWVPLHSGSFVVNAEASDNHGNTIHQEYTITVGSGDEFTSVAGVITDANTSKSISGSLLTFTLIDTTSTIVRTFTTSSTYGGRFTINLPAGVFMVNAAAQGYYTTYLGNTQSAPGTLLTVVLSKKDTINIAMKPLIKGDLFGKVIDATSSSPIVGATITAIYKGTGHDSIGISIPGYGAAFTTLTGDGGSYSMQLHAGLYLVRADAKGYSGEWYVVADSVTGAKLVQIESDIVDTANFSLRRLHEVHACVISGTVYGAHDSVVAGAEVTITMVDGDGRGNDSLYSVTVKTNAAGQYRDTVTCGATYIVFAHKDGFIGLYWRNGHGPLDADRLHIENSIDGVNFVLLRQAYSGTVLSGTVYGCDSVRSPQPSEVTMYMSRENRYIAVATVKTDSNGTYSFQDLPAGTYVIQAVPSNHNYAPGYYTDQNQCTIDWHDAAKIQLLDSAQISGLNIFLHATEHHPGFTNIGGIVHLVGEPAPGFVSGAVVSVYDTAGNLVDYGVADSTGNFTLVNMNIGTYTLAMDRVNYSTVLEGSVVTDYESNVNSASEVDAQLDAIATSVSGTSGLLPALDMLSQNYPNPFTGSTDIQITLPANIVPEGLSLGVYDALGRQVADLTSQIVSSIGNKNKNVVSFNAESLPAGIYFYRLQVAHSIGITKQMLLMR